MATLSDRILAHLDAEQEAIVSGNYDRLARLGAIKTRLFAELDRAPADRIQLKLISDRAGRNLHLLDLARQGFADVSGRLSERAAGRQGFETYGKNGERQDHGNRRPTVEHKA